MIKLLIISLSVVFTLSFNDLYCQSSLLDSLENKLKITSSDSARVRILLEICENTKDYEYSKQLSKNALEISEKLLKINSDDSNLKRNKAWSLLALGISLYKSKNYIDAIKQFENCIQYSLEINEGKIVSKSYINIGHCHYYLNDWDKSGFYYKKASKISFNLKEFHESGEANRNLAELFVERGKFDSAQIYFSKAIKAFEFVKDEFRIAQISLALGRVHYSNANYSEALQLYQEALLVFEKLDKKKDLASTLNNIGIVFYMQKNPTQAIDYYYKSLKLKKEIGDEIGVSNSYINIALIMLELDKLDEALRLFNEALLIKQKINDKSGIADCYANMATIYNRFKKHENAFDYLEKAFAISDELSLDFKKCGLYVNLSKTKLYQNKPLDAIPYAEKAIELSKKINARNFLFLAYENLAEANLKIKNFEKAYYCLSEATILKDSIFNEKSTEQINEMQAKYESEKKQKEIEIQKIELARQHAEIKQQTTQKYAYIIVIFLLFLISVYVFISYRQKRKANILLSLQNAEIKQQKEEITAQRDEIEAQRDKIIIQNSEITASIKYAERIQSVILPDFKIFSENFSDYFILFKPKDIVSGDFYWATKIDNVTCPIVIVAVADCTGHGVPGAFMSMLGISLLNEIVRRKEIVVANEILNDLRKEIIYALQQKGALSASAFKESGEQNSGVSLSVKDGMDISLIVIKPQAQSPKSKVPSEEESEKVIQGESENEADNNQSSINKQSYNAQWAGANNPLWIVRCCSEMPPFEKVASLSKGAVTQSSGLLSNEPEVRDTELTNQRFVLQELKPDKMPIAIYEKMDSFTNHEIQLYSDDLVFLMTDGYQDQFGGTSQNGKKFKSKNIKKLILKNSDFPLFRQKELLKTTLDYWCNNIEQTDDITILAIKI